VLTDRDQGRALELSLTFQLDERERAEFIAIVIPTVGREALRKAILDSPFLRLVGFSFKAPEGNPSLLHLSETRLLAQDNRWAAVQRIVGPVQPGLSIAHSFVQLASVGSVTASAPTPLAFEMLDLDSRSVYSKPIAQVGLSTNLLPGELNPDRSITWLPNQLSRHLYSAFFFDPFRHSVENVQVYETAQLAQDGSNLPLVLHTLRSNYGARFREIERFVQAALPDVGALETPLSASNTGIRFRSPNEAYLVPLYDMGGGV